MNRRLRLGWRENRGRTLVSVAAFRAAAAGVAVRRTETGDFLLDGGDALADALSRLGLVASPADAADGAPFGPVRAAVLAGAGGAYPYYAYYSHAGLSLGMVVQALDPQDAADGALDEIDALFLPGGFAIWGLDRSENVAGLDDAVRAFLARGGGIVASCGGAFYLSSGRPEWLGIVDARPRHTHEYLQTGAAIVDVEFSDAALRAGLPERMEIPYYHGPAYVSAGTNSAALGHFRDVTLPSRLFIDNPLDRANFEASLAGRPAALSADGSNGRAILFSPHPEMGDLVRKYVSLDGYVRKYLPVRGEKTMDETLRYYEPSDSPSFRLILNALAGLGLTQAAAERPARPAATARAPAALDALDSAVGTALDAIGERVFAEESEDYAKLVRKELCRLREMRGQFLAEWLDDRAGPRDATLDAEIGKLAGQAAASLGATPPSPAAAAMIGVELPLRLVEAASRIRRCDAAFAAI